MNYCLNCNISFLAQACPGCNSCQEQPDDVASMATLNHQFAAPQLFSHHAPKVPAVAPLSMNPTPMLPLHVPVNPTPILPLHVPVNPTPMLPLHVPVNPTPMLPLPLPFVHQ